MVALSASFIGSYAIPNQHHHQHHHDTTANLATQKAQIVHWSSLYIVSLYHGLCPLPGDPTRWRVTAPEASLWPRTVQLLTTHLLIYMFNIIFTRWCTAHCCSTLNVSTALPVTTRTRTRTSTRDENVTNSSLLSAVQNFYPPKSRALSV